MSAEDQPQQPRNVAGTRRNKTLLVRSTRCGWCSAHTAALREKSSRPARILQGCSTGRWSRNPRSAAFTPLHRSNVVAGPTLPAPLTLKRHKCRASGPGSARGPRAGLGGPPKPSFPSLARRRPERVARATRLCRRATGPAEGRETCGCSGALGQSPRRAHSVRRVAGRRGLVARATHVGAGICEGIRVSGTKFSAGRRKRHASGVRSPDRRLFLGASLEL